MIAMAPLQPRTKGPSAAIFALTVAAAGCNAIFGIEQASETSGGGQAGSGGQTAGTGATNVTLGGGGTGADTTSQGAMGGSAAGGTTSSGGTGNTGGGPQCEAYWGDGTIQWTDLGGSNLPVTTLQTSDSVSSGYLAQYDRTEISMGSYVDGYCAAGAGITFTGTPIVGQIYSIVDRATFLDNNAFHNAKNAFIETAARPFNANGDCQPPDAKAHWFYSEAGIGSFTVTSLEGTVLAFKTEGVQVIPAVGPNYDGTGMSGVEIDGLSECYYAN